MKEKYLDELAKLAREIREAQEVSVRNDELLLKLETALINLENERQKLEYLIDITKEDGEFKSDLIKDYRFIEGSIKLFRDAYEIENSKPVAVYDTDVMINEKESKGSTFKGFIMGLGISALALLLASSLPMSKNKNKNKNNISSSTNATIASTVTPGFVSFTKPTPTIVPLSKEEQIIKDSKEIYEAYINQEHLPEQFKKTMSHETFENMIRMMRGEFMLENGEIDYNDMQFDELGNFHDRYYESTSFRQLKNNLIYLESAHFFEEGSIAKELVKSYDGLMKEVYTAIQNDNAEEFMKVAKKWGEFIRDAFIPTLSTGDVISIYSVEPEYAYSVASILLTTYGPTIMEYQGARDIDVCIPFCYNSNGELEEISLSKLIYAINETPINTLAQRAGMSSIWEENNDPIIVQLGKQTRGYFRSKYNQEVEYIYDDPYENGYQPVLK